MTLYHGSSVVIREPNVAFGRAEVDFGQRLQRKYDVVEGGVANDNVIDTVEDFENGIITADQALGQLQFKKVNHQLVIHSQGVVDRFLRFQSSEEVHNAR